VRTVGIRLQSLECEKRDLMKHVQTSRTGWRFARGKMGFVECLALGLFKISEDSNV
jgi:hypothetical protein